MAGIRPATDEEKKARDFSIPAGRHVLGALEFERKSAQKWPCADYLRVKFCRVKPDGTNGRSFKDMVGLLVDTGGRSELEKRVNFNCMRLQIWMEVCGYSTQESFAAAGVELDENGRWELGEIKEHTDKVGDRNFCKLFVGRAFVAEVDRTESNGYTNNSIKRMVPRKQWTDAELEAVQAWEEAQRGKGRPEDYADDGGSGEPAAADDQFDDELDPADDDDVPLGW